jgi:hypothetical protein
MKARHQGKLKAPIKEMRLEVNSDAHLNAASEIKLTKGSVLGYVLRKALHLHPVVAPSVASV